ncbi:MAG: transcriptional regulator [Verrucomicrobia bacterium]|jgi:nitrogen regulatory protein P-II 2|nr:MAG: transcriptional regulator [Verrucomicrobiota bacterium]
MNTYPMKLVTIVCEAYAQDTVTKLLNEVGAHGWTLFAVEGDGSQGKRPADIKEFANIQIEAVVQPEVADKLLERLANDFFPRYAMIAFESEVRVLRREKF